MALPPQKKKRLVISSAIGMGIAVLLVMGFLMLPPKSESILTDGNADTIVRDSNPGSALPVNAAQALLDCTSMPLIVNEGSMLDLSVKLIDAETMLPIEGENIVWTVSPAGRMISALTDSEGQAESSVSLAGLSEGLYSVSAYLTGDVRYPQGASCMVQVEVADASDSFDELAVLPEDDFIEIKANDTDALDEEILFGGGVEDNTTDGTIVDVIEEDDGFNFGGGGGCNDSIPPNVSITSPSTGSTIEGPSNGVMLNIEGTASDDNPSCGFKEVKVAILNLDTNQVVRWYRLAAPGAQGDWSEWNYSFKVYDEASYRVVARAIDDDGNRRWQSVIVDVEYNLDVTQPSIAITTPTEGDSVTGSPVVEVEVTGTSFDQLSSIQQVEVRTGTTSYELATPKAGNWSKWSHVLTFDSAGSKTIFARATDSAGNSDWVSIVIDVNIASPA